MSNTILKIDKLSHSYGKFKVITDISFEVEKGCITALIGPNGAGKTTFYNAISGKFPPTSGRVIFDGIDITGMPAYKVADLGLVRSFQITNIFNNLSVLDNILIPLILHHKKRNSMLKSVVSHKELIKKGEEILERLSLSKFSKRKASELAYGDKRLIEIGIVLAREPKMILLDEPTAGMNPEETESMIKLIKELSIMSKTTLFFTEHDMNFVFNAASYIYVLHQGGLLAYGTPEEIKSNEQVKEAYLGGSLYSKS